MTLFGKCWQCLREAVLDEDGLCSRCAVDGEAA
jgi:5-methylcytosine-specific restriction endonuclease McrA